MFKKLKSIFCDHCKYPENSFSFENLGGLWGSVGDFPNIFQTTVSSCSHCEKILSINHERLGVLESQQQMQVKLTK